MARADVRGRTAAPGDLLERAARATPAAAEDRSGGWWLRHAGGSAWWSGAVLAHGPADRLAQRVDAAERFYAGHRAVARFQICPGCPAGLDRLLAERGYRRRTPVSLLTADSRAVGIPPSPDWLTVRTATGTGPVTQPQARVTVFAAGEPVGTGRAVADDGWAGIFSMATSPRARRRGVARVVLATLARWAATQGAPGLYLQVEQSNTAADRLYRGAGFAPVATYFYRERARP